MDLATGAFVYDHTDLALGGAEPRGLSFSRSTRLRHRNDADLGFGWRHNWHLRLTRRSAPDAALGKDEPVHAAAMLVAIHVALDFMDIESVKPWACALLTCGWAVDAITDNAASVQIGPTQRQFIKHPDGAFLRPTGVPATLVPVGGGHEVRFRHGNTIVFDFQGRGTTIRDPYGKELTLTYNGTNGKRGTVRDCYDRTLTFAYSSGALESVLDSTGMKVTFFQSNGDLTECTDPEFQGTLPPSPRWTHSAHHSFTHVALRISRGPSDGCHTRPGQPRDLAQYLRRSGPGERTTLARRPDAYLKLYCATDATLEEDPLGGRRAFHYDLRRRLIAEVDASGNKTSYGYNGQDHRTSVTTPDGKTTTTLYDSDHNPTLITDPSPTATQFFYDPQQLDYVIDGRGKTWEFAFNAFHQPSTSEPREGVLTELLYYETGPHAGLLWKKVVEGTYTTTYEYDTYGQLLPALEWMRQTPWRASCSLQNPIHTCFGGFEGDRMRVVRRLAAPREAPVT